jgi:hypothetical protein
MVREVAQIVGEAEEYGDINDECSSCIISQFAKDVPVYAQRLCGEEEGCDCPGFFRQESYPCDCFNRSAGTVCIKYADDYILLVEDSIRSWSDYYCNGQLVSIAYGFKAEYHHIHGTNCIKATSIIDE